MQKHILVSLALFVMVTCGRAADTNQTVMPPVFQPLWEGGFDPGLLARAAWLSAVSTNQPLWDGSISLGLTLTRGNSDALMANTAFREHRDNLTNEWTFGVDGTYGEVEGVENAETLHGFGQYNHLFTERMYGYMRLEAWHDGIEDVIYRTTINPGVGYYFIKNRQTLLAVGAGPGAVSEKLDGERNQYMTLRLAERLEHKFNGHARFWSYVELLPQVNMPDNFLINSEVGVESPLTKNLSLQTVIQDNFANIPAPGHKDNDVKLVSGVAYKF
jgi:hypothetical protein